MISYNFTFLSHPKICSGLKALEHIPFELESLNARKPLVITSPRWAKKGLDKTLVKALYDSNITIGALFTNAPHYPSLTIINELSKLYRDRGCDSIIALGSGGITQIAKAVNMVVSLKADILQCTEITISSPLKPLICVPTADCEGGEMASVAYYERFEKQSDFLYPDVIVIDSRITRHATKEEVANCALTSLAHAIEACGIETPNPINDAYAHTALQFIYQYLPKAFKRTCNKDASVAIVNAAACADTAFSNAPQGIVHTLAQAIASDTNLKPGIVMGILLRHSLAAKLQAKGGIRPELLLALAGIDTYAKTPEKDRQKTAYDYLITCINVTKEFVPSTLKELKIPHYKLKEYALLASAKNRQFKESAYFALLEKSWEGK
ncbi:MAG: iron-containing alcohol dehydrogenase [Spirochaetes bacterium]|nr:iron-containing alcohol dehydrogenase [Spirochaetota bacterium]